MKKPKTKKRKVKIELQPGQKLNSEKIATHKASSNLPKVRVRTFLKKKAVEVGEHSKMADMYRTLEVFYFSPSTNVFDSYASIAYLNQSLGHLVRVPAGKLLIFLQSERVKEQLTLTQTIETTRYAFLMDGQKVFVSSLEKLAPVDPDQETETTEQKS